MIGEINPEFARYGQNSQRLNEAEAIQATRDERIRSCWGIIINNAQGLYKTLNHRQKANYSLEDIMTDLWIVLSERDHLWDPGRGTYPTFAWRLIHNELREIFDRSNTVALPRNSSCRVKQYQELSKNGPLDSRKAKTYEDIRRITRTIFSITAMPEDMYHSNEQIEEHVLPVSKKFTTAYYSKIPDPKSLAPESNLENSEHQDRIQKIMQSLNKKFPGANLTSQTNKPKVKRFLMKLGVNSKWDLIE